MKRILFCLGFVFLCSIGFSAKYKIANISYDVLGITKPYAIERNVEVDKSRVFNSYSELNLYIKDLEQQLKNQRVFSESNISLSYDDIKGGEEVSLVHLHIFASDSKHLLIVPYPKYDSNNGLTLKAKVKDTNFLGTMSPLNADVSFFSGENSETEEWENKLGFSLSYDYPFKLGPFKSSWNNSVSFDYTFGKQSPEFNVSSGFTFILPFDMFSISLDLKQSVVRNFDYKKYGDDLYFIEEATFSVPIILQKIDNWGNVTWSPYVSYVWNWDADGISKENKDLSSPLLTVGHTIGTSRINWIGNFRNGLSATAGQSLGYNFQKDNFIPKVWAELIGYKALAKYVGLSGRLYTFAAYNGTEKIGGKLRGIKDDQKYEGTDTKALSVSTAILFNIDLPIHIITTDWCGWFDALFGEESKVSKAFRFMRYFDFEMQLSPFIDAALTQNTATGRTFSIKDGFYAAGLEVIIFPQKWRSIEIRASLGVDVGRKIIKKAVSSLIDDSWRTGSAYELYIGIGMHY